MNIPTSFNILSHKVDVKYRDDLNEDCECCGRFVPHKNLIELQIGYSDTYALVTFWHEVMHAIATHMGMKELNEDEEKIDKLAQGVVQVLLTKRGSLKCEDS